MIGTDWADEDVQLLKTLRADKSMTTDKIAARMGRTRNSIAGAIRRYIMWVKPKKVVPAPYVPLRKNVHVYVKRWKKEDVPPMETPTVPSVCIPFIDIKPCQCVWVIGEPKNQIMCGLRRATGSPYCAAHKRIASGTK